MRNNAKLSPPSVADIFNKRVKHFEVEHVKEEEMSSDDQIEGEFSPIEQTKVIKVVPTPPAAENPFI